MCLYDKNIKSKSQNPHLLTSDEEKTLIVAHQNGDPDAAVPLIASIQHILNYVVMRHANKNVGYDDLYQQCLIGAIRAIDAFDVTRGVRLSTFAKFYMRAEADSLVQKNAYCARVCATRAERKFYFRAGGFDNDPSMTFAQRVSALSKATGLDERDVETTMGFLSQTPESYDDTLTADRGKDVLGEVVDMTNTERLHDAIDCLSERQQFIIVSYFFDFMSQREIADELGLHKNSVMTAIKEALERLKGIMRLHTEDVVNG